MTLGKHLIFAFGTIPCRSGKVGLAAVCVVDEVHKDALRAVNLLKKDEIRPVILTGDLWFTVASGDDGVTMLLLLNTLRLERMK